MSWAVRTAPRIRISYDSSSYQHYKSVVPLWLEDLFVFLLLEEVSYETSTQQLNWYHISGNMAIPTIKAHPIQTGKSLCVQRAHLIPLEVLRTRSRITVFHSRVGVLL